MGAHLVKSLLQSGNVVRVFDNQSRGTLGRLESVANEFEFIEGDLRDPDAVRQATRKMDVVCHLGFVNGTATFYERPAYVLDVGVKGILNVLDGCIHEDVRELIVASSSEVYQTPPAVPTDENAPLSIPDVHNPRYSYAGGKILSGLMAIHYGREHFKRVVIFRPHNVYGPDMGWDHVIPELTSRLVELRGECPDGEILLPVQGSGEQSRAFVFIDDFIDGLMCVIDKGEHLNIYNIGTREELQITEVAHRIASCLGLTTKIITGPEAKGGTLRRCPDIAKLEGLGFLQRVDFDEGLRRTVAWYEKKVLEKMGLSNS